MRSTWKLPTFSNKKLIVMPKTKNILLRVFFSANPFLQVILHPFYIKKPPKDRKTSISKVEFHEFFAMWFDGKISAWSRFTLLFHTVYWRSLLQIDLTKKIMHGSEFFVCPHYCNRRSVHNDVKWNLMLYCI